MAKDKKDLQTKQRKTENNSSAEKDQGNDIWQDERFQHLVADPRFKQLHKSRRKVKIDKRFQSMFTDKKFNVKYTVDKYGRRVNTTAADDLRKYYELDSSASDEEKEDDATQEAAEQLAEEKAITNEADDSKKKDALVVTDSVEEDGDEEDETPKTLRERLLDPDIDYARGEGRLVTDSSTGDESSEEEDNDPVLQLDHVWGELDYDAATTDESTHRLAVCNMDWDRIRAVDLMVLFNSFLPRGGSILSVKIYISEYGKERMAEEERYGPAELVGLGTKGKQLDNSTDSEEEVQQEQDSDAEHGEDYHMEKLRQYQLNRLRYYYAVLECDSVKTADVIYRECDGNEYESSATRIDLRFIPNDTRFDGDEPTDVCTELPENNVYQPRLFTTTALQQAKVELTWDETAMERRELGEKLLTGKLEDVDDAEVRKIVAYSSEDDGEEEEELVERKPEEKEYIQAAVKIDDKSSSKAGSAEERATINNSQPTSGESRTTGKKKDDSIAKYKALLAEINAEEEKEKQERANRIEMEVSWTLEPTKDDDNSDDSDEPTLKPKKPLLTPIEKVLQKRSEKNKKRKEERKKKRRQALGHSEDGSGDSDSDDTSVPDGVDMNDPYFAEEFASGDFVVPKASKKGKEKISKKQRKIPKEADLEEKQNAEELQLLLDDDDFEMSGKQHFSLTKIQKAENETKSKRKRKRILKKSKSEIAAGRNAEITDNFRIDLNDQRFGAIYSSHDFNIDPTDSHFKKTKAMEQIIHEKLKRRHGAVADEIIAAPQSYPAKQQQQESPTDTATEPKRPKKQLENKLLVNSLKNKIRMKQNLELF